MALSAHAAGLSAAGGLTEAVRDHTHCIGPSETSAFAGCSTRHLIASCYSRLAHSRILYLTPPGLLVLLLPCHKRKSFQDTPFAVSAAHVRALRKYIITWLEEVCIAIHKSKVCFRGAQLLSAAAILITRSTYHVCILFLGVRTAGCRNLFGRRKYGSGGPSHGV